MLSPARLRMTGLALLATTALSACSSDDDSGGPTGPVVGAATITSNITTNRTFFAETTYTLSGFIQVTNGATLTIQPGTKIVGDFNTVGSSLFITRGARIVANGTASAPIVFTSSRPVGQRQAGDWGGLIIIGNATANRATAGTVLEGTGTGPSNPAQNYGGGTDDNDNSGILRYVRVEFAGYATAPDQELNSFTFAAVGRGTQMEYLQAMYGLDDSFEWFGGTADARYLVSYEAGDDHFDMSEGFRGRLQNLIALQTVQVVPRAGAGNVSSDPTGIENDGCNGAGCVNGQDSAPFTTPVVANFTLVGTGPGVVDNTSGGIGMVLRRGTGGFYVNGVTARWPRAGISIRDASTGLRIASGDFAINNVLTAGSPVHFEAGTGRLTYDAAVVNNVTTSADAPAALFAAFPAAAPTGAASFDWTPSAAAAIRTGGLTTFTGKLATSASGFVTGTAYRGAADPNGAKWWAGWTVYASN